jgi:hypothetical protein
MTLPRIWVTGGGEVAHRVKVNHSPTRMTRLLLVTLVLQPKRK